MKAHLASILTVALGVYLMAGEANATEIIRGPYLQSVTDSSIYVVWEQDTATDAEVHFGEAGSLDRVVLSESARDHHVMLLDGLVADTAYTYAVYDLDGPLSEQFTFRTAPDAGVGFRFVAFGDTRSDHAAHQRVVDAIDDEEDVAFVVNTGDLVSDGEVADQWDTFFEVEHDLVAEVPIYPVIGNHEEHDGDVSNFIDAFVLPRNSPEPEHYYSFDYGNTHFVVLDGHVQVDVWYYCALRSLFMDDCFNAEQVAWLEDDLTRTSQRDDIDHIFVVTHAGPYSSKEGRTGNAHMRLLQDIFLNTGVTAIISGHDHYYEHGLSGVGIHYMISGGGGASLYDISSASWDPHEVYVNESVHHYIVLDVVGPRVNVRTQTPDGRILEEFSIGPDPECLEHVDCVIPSTACEGATRLCIDYTCVFECPDPAAEPTPTEIVEIAPDAGSDLPSTPDLTPDTTTAPDAEQADGTAETTGVAPVAQESTSEEGCGCVAATARGASASTLCLLVLGFVVHRRRI